MGKFMVRWEIDQSKIPVDPIERGEGWSALMTMVRQDLEKGVAKDWGAFLGESGGYCIYEGSETEIMSTLQQYVPFCTFSVKAVATEDHVNQMLVRLTR